MKTKVKLNSLQRNGLVALFAAFLVVGLATSARADFDAEIGKIQDVTDSLAGMVAAFTDVVVLPMGISSAVKTFRHVVLMNV